VQTDIKKWTVGSPIQGPLDAVEAIRSKRPFEADQVRRVTVRLALRSPPWWTTATSPTSACST
jgi:hypothetical protein